MSNFTSDETELNPFGRATNQNPTGRPTQLNPFARVSFGPVTPAININARITENAIFRLTEDGNIRIIE